VEVSIRKCSEDNVSGVPGSEGIRFMALIPRHDLVDGLASVGLRKRDRAVNGVSSSRSW